MDGTTMKNVFSLLVILAMAFLPLNILAQPTIPILNNVPTPVITTVIQGTPTAVLRVNPIEEDIQPPTDEPIGDDMGLMAMPKGASPADGTATPVSLETMQSTITALIPNTTPVTTPANVTPTVANALPQPATTVSIGK